MTNDDARLQSEIAHLRIDLDGCRAALAQAERALEAELHTARAVVEAVRAYLSRATTHLPVEKADTDALGVLIEMIALYDETTKIL